MQDTDLFAPIATPPARTDGYVLIEFGGITLAISQGDILTIEHGSELAAPLPGEAPLGWFESAQGPWPVFGLDHELQLLDRLPNNRAYLTFLKGLDSPLGLLCDSVKIIGRRSDLAIRPLPIAMQDDAQPIRAIARLDDKHLALIVGEGLLAAHVADLSERAPGGALQ